MRLNVLKRTILLFFLLLAAGLAYLQLIKGPEYSRLSQNNRIKLIRLTPARGSIYDRNKRLVAGTRLMFNLAILPQELKDLENTIATLSSLTGISEEKLLREYKKNFFAPFIPVAVARDIPKETAIALESKEDDIPGLVIQTEPLRDYRYGVSTAHLLGYLGSITEEELEKLEGYGVRIRDLVGRSGLEEKHDEHLRGLPGGMQVEVNNRGHKVRVLGSREAQEGKELHLTIDIKLQNLIHDLLVDKDGSSIVMNVETGEILAMVNNPGFDPNVFIAAVNQKQEAREEVTELLRSREAPLLNRAISGVYSPGSIFKIIVAAAALEKEKITPQTTFSCPGRFRIGNRDFFCWDLDGHGTENIYSALAHSCNVFFYRMGLSLGADEITSFARKFGLGLPTGVDLPYETAGLVPSKAWKLKTQKERWYDGETANFSIGQGYLLATPLQMTRVVAAVANGGYLVKPHVVKSTKVSSKEKIGVKEETLEIIREGMRQVVEDVGGTGHNARVFGVEWAAKTGTAQAPKGKPHGWFAGFYPADDPRLAILVFLEHGGSGGQAPAKIAKNIIEYIKKEEGR